MGGSAAEPRSEEEGDKKDLRVLRRDVSIATALAGGCQSTCPTNILPAMLKVSVGEVPIVICISHEICTGHQKHGPSSYWGGVGGVTRACEAARGTF